MVARPVCGSTLIVAIHDQMKKRIVLFQAFLNIFRFPLQKDLSTDKRLFNLLDAMRPFLINHRFMNLTESIFHTLQHRSGLLQRYIFSVIPGHF